jgi:hypothetical protein
MTTKHRTAVVTACAIAVAAAVWLARWPRNEPDLAAPGVDATAAHAAPPATRRGSNPLPEHYEKLVASKYEGTGR